MKIQEHISLKEFTTFRIGGPARYFITASSIDELKAAILFAEEKHLPLFILGGGSNVLVSDEGFPGVVIKIEMKGREIKELDLDTQNVEVIAGAGEEWDSFVEYCVSYGLYGIENLSYIPGSVGAAPVQNIGAYGSEVKDSLSWVEVFNTEKKEIETFSKEECIFGYRDSIFKKTEGKKYVITRVAFLLSRNGTLNINYKDITEYIKNNTIEEVSLQKVRDIVVDIRKKKLPDVREVGTAGSLFKNPIIEKTRYEELVKIYPLMPQYPINETQVKIPAAWILDTICGLKDIEREMQE